MHIFTYATPVIKLSKWRWGSRFFVGGGSREEVGGSKFLFKHGVEKEVGGSNVVIDYTRMR